MMQSVIGHIEGELLVSPRRLVGGGSKVRVTRSQDEFWVDLPPKVQILT